MSDVDRVIAAYNLMDQRRKDEALTILEATAKAHPAKEPAKKPINLTIAVNNSGSAFAGSRHRLSSSQYLLSPSIVSITEKIQ